MARRLSNTDAIYRRQFQAYRKNARTRGLDFGLSEESSHALFAKPCHYCGQTDTRCTEPSRYKVPFCVPCNGLDRVRNDEGYIEGNVVPCCSRCNVAKGALSMQQWMAWLAALVSRQILQRYEGTNP